MWSAIEFMCDKETIEFGNSTVIDDVWFIWGKINIFYPDFEYLGLYLVNQVYARLNRQVQRTLNYSIVCFQILSCCILIVFSTATIQK